MDNFWNGCPPKMSDGRFLQDFRTSSRREQYIRTVNDLQSNDAQRSFYQNNGEILLDREWETLKKNNKCFHNCCIHSYPTRTTPGMLHDEMRIYNCVRKGQLAFTDTEYPHCKLRKDYRLTQTKMS